MKKLLLIIAIAAFFVVGCGKKSGKSADVKEIKIGVIVPKSGSLATYGLESLNGMSIAAEEINAKGGINGLKIKLVVEDNQGNTSQSMNAYKKLVTLEGVVGVVGPVTSGNGMALKPSIAQFKTPLISPTGTAVALTKGNEYVSRVCFIDPFQGKAAAIFAFDKLNKKTAVILYDASNDYSTGLSAAFEKEFTSKGGKILKKVAFKNTDKDFSAQLTQIKSLKPEFVYVPSYHPTAGPIMNQAKKSGINAVFMGGDGWDSGKLKDLAGEGYAGNYFTTHFSKEDTDSMVVSFVKRFQAKASGQNAGAMAALGYDAMLIMADSIKRTIAKLGKDKIGTDAFKTELKNQINSTSNFKGVTGLITLDKDRNAIKSIVIIKTTEKGPQFLTKLNP